MFRNLDIKSFFFLSRCFTVLFEDLENILYFSCVFVKVKVICLSHAWCLPERKKSFLAHQNLLVENCDHHNYFVPPPKKYIQIYVHRTCLFFTLYVANYISSLIKELCLLQLYFLSLQNCICGLKFHQN